VAGKLFHKTGVEGIVELTPEEVEELLREMEKRVKNS